MAKRKTISKKTRFEVFKRDSFKCQYCGKSAPEIVLEIDHIEPVSKGGDNDITNLITSCFDCNRGKGDRTLADDTVIQKQRDQLEELNERRTQIEMIADWKRELLNLESELADVLIEYIDSMLGEKNVNETGKTHVIKWLKKYDIEVLYQATDKSFDQYQEAEKAFQMIPRIAHYIVNPQEDYMKDIYYIRGIVRNRFNYHNPQLTIVLLVKAYKEGIQIDELKQIAFDSENWTEFRESLEELIEKGD